MIGIHQGPSLGLAGLYRLFGTRLWLCLPFPALEKAFKKALYIPVNATAAQLFQRDPAGAKTKFDRTRVGIGLVAGNTGRYEFGLAFQLAIAGRIVLFKMDKEQYPGSVPTIADGDDIPPVLRIVAGELMLAGQGIDGIKDRGYFGFGFVGFRQDEHKTAFFTKDIGVPLIQQLAVDLSLMGDRERILIVHPRHARDPGFVVGVEDGSAGREMVVLVKTKDIEYPPVLSRTFYEQVGLLFGHLDLAHGIEMGMGLFSKPARQHGVGNKTRKELVVDDGCGRLFMPEYRIGDQIG